MRVQAKQIREQLVSVLHAWGMSDAHADSTAEMMLETDLRRYFPEAACVRAHRLREDVRGPWPG